jgi:hypothetical protein
MADRNRELEARVRADLNAGSACLELETVRRHDAPSNADSELVYSLGFQ